MFQAQQQIGNYTLIKQLGKGGFGEVWLAERQTALVTKKVALKLPHNDQVDLETIRQEAALWEQASGHPNVLPIIDADIYDGQVVIVSEYAEGGTLADILKNYGRLPIKAAIEMTIGILKGLEFLHYKKIIHRDIKPANILLQGNTPRLADFGISRAMNTEAVSMTIVGTDAYMSPEAFDGIRSAQTDIWSVGVVLYQMLNGHLPFPQIHPTERMFAILQKDFPPLTGEIPPDLRIIVYKAMAKLPENRFGSSREMIEELQKVLANINYPAFAPTEGQDKRILSVHETDGENLSVVTGVPLPETRHIHQFLPTEVNHLANRTAKRPARSFYYIGGAAAALILISLLGIIGIIGLWQYYKYTALDTKNLIPFKKYGKYGFVDRSKKIVVEPVYDFVKPFAEDLAPVYMNTKAGYIDKSFKLFIPYKYDDTYRFDNGVAKVALNKKYGLIDKTGKELTPIKYDEISDFYDDIARVKADNNYGFVDRTGKEVVQVKYFGADPPGEGLISVCTSGSGCGYIDKTGKQIIPFDYNSAWEFSDGLAAVKKDGKWMFIDKSAKEIVSLKYDYSYGLHEGLARVKLNDKWGFIDKTGNEIISPKYDDAADFSEGLAEVKLNDKWGFIDKTGKEITPIKYTETISFKDGTSRVGLNKKSGFVNKDGKEFIPLKYDLAGTFTNGLALVENQDYFFYIGLDGTEYFEK